jgi:hypothetical protein
LDQVEQLVTARLFDELGSGSSTAEQLYQADNQSEHQQQVDDADRHLENEDAEEPKDEQNGGDRKKHGCSPY